MAELGERISKPTGMCLPTRSCAPSHSFGTRRSYGRNSSPVGATFLGHDCFGLARKLGEPAGGHLERSFVKGELPSPCSPRERRELIKSIPAVTCAFASAIPPAGPQAPPASREAAAGEACFENARASGSARTNFLSVSQFHVSSTSRRGDVSAASLATHRIDHR